MKKKYGIFTAISMIVGIVIGSGIFFKSDNILISTGGSVGMGVVLFCLSAFGVVFGALAVSQLASRTSGDGGVIRYCEKFISSRVGCGVAWFYTFVYFPALTAVVSWIVGVYMCMIIGLPSLISYEVAIGMGAVTVLYLINILAPKLAGILQVSATIIKIIPLIALAVCGVIFGKGDMSVPANMGRALETGSLISAIAPVAFAFDGWIISASISGELKNEKRDLPIAMTLAPIFILILYIAYFVGIVRLVGADTIVESGDSHVYLAAQKLMGGIGGRIVLAFVVVSVIGTLNGLILGHSRMPYVMAQKNMIFNAKWLNKVSKRLDMPINSAIFSFVLAIVFSLINYLTQRYSLTPNSDVSEIAVVAQYAIYMLLYYQVFKLWKKKEIKSVVKGAIIPIFAALGAVFIFVGGFANPLFILNLVISGTVGVGGVIYYMRRRGVSEEESELENSANKAGDDAAEEAGE